MPEAGILRKKGDKSTRAKKRREKALFTLGIYLTVLTGTILSGIISGAALKEIFANISTSIVGIMVFVYYYLKDNGKMVENILAKRIFIIFFMLSNVIVALESVVQTGTIWMLAVAVIAVREGMGHAVPCHALLMLQYMVLSPGAAGNIRKVIFHAVLGILLAFIISEVKRKKLFIYAAVILTALTVVLLLVLYRFDFYELACNKEYVGLCTAGNIILLTAAWITYCIDKKHEHMVLSGLFDIDSELMQRIMEHSSYLYSHSVQNGRLSYKAAAFMGFDRLLAGTGGLYHEAGRIYSEKGDIDSFNRIAREYRFPAVLASAARQNSTSSEKPKSPEEAIIMLSDCIISISEYLEKKGKREEITDEKIVKNIFSNRIAKGNLDESGMDRRQLNKLMGFYIDNAFSEEQNLLDMERYG